MNGERARGPAWRIAGIAAAALLAAGVAAWFICWRSPTTVLLVRHADRQQGADALSPAGAARARQLAHVMEKSGVSAIYTSQAARTRETAAPTASLLGIAPAAVAASDVAGLVGTIRARHAGGRVLVVGHSDTVPQIVAALGGPAVSIGSGEYDNLYLLTLCRCRWGGVGLANLQYGEASP